MSRYQGIVDKDLGMRGMRAALSGAAGRSFTKVGLPSGAPSAVVPDGPASDMEGVVKIAAVHEFGAPNRNIPERSFIRATYDENLTKLQQIQEVELSKILLGQSKVRESLARMGEWLAAKMKNKIRQHIPPPLSSKTIAAKGSNVPLIDSGQLIQSITHVEVTE
jgi:phage gpG-like protein